MKKYTKFDISKIHKYDMTNNRKHSIINLFMFFLEEAHDICHGLI